MFLASLFNNGTFKSTPATYHVYFEIMGAFTVISPVSSSRVIYHYYYGTPTKITS